jgi:hypothetical protein
MGSRTGLKRGKTGWYHFVKEKAENYKEQKSRGHEKKKKKRKMEDLKRQNGHHAPIYPSKPCEDTALSLDQRDRHEMKRQD